MKTILLTGAQGGIGSVAKAAFEATGARVLEVDRKDADISSYADIKTLARKTSEHAPLDWLVLAHGYIGAETDFLKQSPEEIRTTFDTNTLSPIFLTQLLLPHLRPGGGVIFISSSAGLTANGRTAAYSASKAAINSFMQALARNMPEQKFFAVCPGPTNTPMRERIAHDADKQQNPGVVVAVLADLVNGNGAYKSGDIILVKNGETSVAARL